MGMECFRTLSRTVCIVLCASVAAVATAHFNLQDPKPYNAIDCNPPECPGPCPSVWRAGRGRASNSPNAPAATWRRGQRVVVRWHRNNHQGGFVRRALVPISHMRNRRWHARTAFEWGCFSSGRHRCKRQRGRCGSDKRKFAYSATVKVPLVYPDGDYVFAQAWFGGLHWTRKRAYFANYYTCAFVRIRGGPQRPRFFPRWAPASGWGKCVTTSDRLGECDGIRCKRNPVVATVPAVFQKGKRPPAIYYNFLKKLGKLRRPKRLKYDARFFVRRRTQSWEK